MQDVWSGNPDTDKFWAAEEDEVCMCNNCSWRWDAEDLPN